MGERPSVLIVDDDPGTCETLSDILEGRGFNAVAVRSGEECIETIKNRHFDAVLMDIKMPGMSGVEAFRKIKEVKKTPSG